MELIINMIELQNFKGAKHKVVKLNKGINKIMGCNGSGKSTIINALLWTFADCDYNMVKNPTVTPIGESECKTEVKVWMTIDGKECSVSKIQKFKSKEVDGKVSTSVSNTYTINDVEKGLRDFTADMIERGVDMENFLIYTHPSAFTADTSKQGREKIRKVLFDMVEDITDADIIADMDVPELKALLDNYKLEEVEQMQKSTLRKINETCGKNNELIDAQISGIINSKSTLDKKSLEAQKTEYETELQDIEKSIADMSKADNDKRSKISELKRKIVEIENAENDKLHDEKSELHTNLREVENEANELEIKITNLNNKKNGVNINLDSANESLEGYRKLYKNVQDEVLSEEDTKCPTCGREYDKDRIEEMKADFESSKNERLNAYKSKAEGLKRDIKGMEKQIKDIDKELEKLKPEYEKLSDEAKEISEKLRSLRSVADYSANKDYQKTKDEIAKLETELAQSNDLKLQEKSNRQSYLINMLRQVIGELAVVERNKELDGQIEQLREDKKQAEINRAAAEKIIDQVEKFKREKNDRLTEIINSKFTKVSWRLFKTLKNGTVEEDVTPMINGKAFESCNGSLITLAKISICADLQRYYKQKYPILCDDFSLMSSNTSTEMDIDTQFIGLVVTEDKEIKIEGE